MPSDSPRAYLCHDYVTETESITSRQTYAIDDIRKRIRRDFTRKAKEAQRHSGGKLKRNNVKSREKRAIKQQISHSIESI